MRERIGEHWPEYLIEAASLGIFLMLAAGFTVLLEHPASPVRQSIDNAVARRSLMGLAMGITAMAIIYSPMGQRSGAHINPAATLMFYRLGRVHAVDAVGYMAAQFAGGMLGILVAATLLSPWVAAPTVHFAATVPGVWGSLPALAAEAVMTFVLMTIVLHVANRPRWSRYAGVATGALVAIYITVEAPVSGMSLNAARTLGPALLAGEVDSLWIYFVGPTIGMLMAAELYVRTRGLGRVFCAKFHHGATTPCIFNCRFAEIHS